MTLVAARRKKKQQTFTEREYSLSNAKAFLGRLLDKAARGEEVIIARKSERFSLQHMPTIEPIPQRPHGYFEFDAGDFSLDKKFMKANVRPKLQDLK